MNFVAKFVVDIVVKVRFTIIYLTQIYKCNIHYTIFTLQMLRTMVPYARKNTWILSTYTIHVLLIFSTQSFYCACKNVLTYYYSNYRHFSKTKSYAALANLCVLNLHAQAKIMRALIIFMKLSIKMRAFLKEKHADVLLHLRISLST